MQSRVAQFGELTCRIVANDFDTPPEFGTVLCHGYGAPGTDLVPLGAEIAARSSDLTERSWFFFPQAPLDMAELGPFYDARAWWHIDVGRFERAMRSGQIDALRNDVPEGLASARRKLTGCVDGILRSTGLETSRVAIGGFSQGAMLATDLVLRSDEAPAALLILSGTLLAEAEWKARAARRQGLPTFVSHGRQDPLLPFAASEWLRDFLTGAGLDVTFWPFDGGHTIDRVALAHVATLLERVAFPDGED